MEAALVANGCPASTASGLAAQLTLERDDGVERYCLLGTCVAADSKALGQEPLDDAAVEVLAHAVASENAEAHDRTARGEAGYRPLWALAGRSPRI